MEYFDKLSVEENEKLARERFKSGWKDEIRHMLEPFENRLGELHPKDATMELLLKLVANLAGRTVRNAVVNHCFLRQIKRLEAKNL
jgi:hypothetical protein